VLRQKKTSIPVLYKNSTILSPGSYGIFNNTLLLISALSLCYTDPHQKKPLEGRIIAPAKRFSGKIVPQEHQPTS